MHQPKYTTAETVDPLLLEPSDTGGSILQRSQVENASINSEIIGNALVARSDLRMDRNGRPYIAMSLQCAGGATIEARWWNFPHHSSDCPVQGVVHQITARVDVFQGERQLRVTRALPIPAADLSEFVTSTRRSKSELMNEFDAVCSSLDDHMRAVVEAVLYDDNIRADFCAWPASHQRHGAVRHGLLAHSLRVVELVQRIADSYGIDGLQYDRPLAKAAALLHDIGKLWTLPAIAGSVIPESATYFDHVTLSVMAVQRAANTLEDYLPTEKLHKLTHAILAHHGRREWGAACEPHTVEAWLVHLADLAESRLWAFSNEEAASQDSPAELAQTGVGPIQDASTADSLLI